MPPDRFETLKKTYGFGPGAGFVPTSLPGVRFFWSTEHVARAPLIYSAGLVIILQGHKKGWLQSETFVYDESHYLILSVPVPFECETSASAEAPLLGLFIDIDRVVLRELAALNGPLENTPSTTPPIGVAPAELHDEMRDAVERLIRALCSQSEIRALGSGILREIFYHALSGPHGAALTALSQTNTQFDRVARAITQIRTNYSETLRIEDLAATAGMSNAVFHRAFKAVTGATPYQYLQTVRLHRAKEMIVANGIPVNQAAQRVGYDDPARFSRAFKKHFKISPKSAQLDGYCHLDV